MLQETIGALGYEETDLVSKATLRPLLEYGVAAPAVGVALLLQFGVVPRGVPRDGPCKLLFAAVRFDGLGTERLATALPVVPSNNLILASRDKIQSVMSARGLRLTTFILEVGLISALVGALPAARRRAEANVLTIEQGEEELWVRARQQRTISMRFKDNIESAKEAGACWPYIGRSPVTTERKR